MKEEFSILDFGYDATESLDERILTVCNKLGVDACKFTRARINKPDMRSYWKVIHYFRKKDYSYPEIGKMFNKKHTSIMGCYKNKNFRAKEK